MRSSTSPKLRAVFYLLLLGGGIGLATLLWLQYDSSVDASAQAAAQGAEPPVSKILPPSLLRLSAQQLVSAPTVDGFQAPVAPPHAAFTYDAQPFGAPNAKRGGAHSGQDHNGIGGANSDLQLPVYAAARGLVVYSGIPSAGWGRTVILAHRLPDGRIIQTLYSHLDSAIARAGSLLGRGEPLGTIGTAEGAYLAHLHYECIESRAIEAAQRAYHPAGTMNRLDPASLMRDYPAPAHPDRFRELRRLFSQEAPSSPPMATPALPEGSIPVNPQHFLSPES